MELRHLRYFVAIAEERSFTRAAERLWVAQPGLSTQIRRLEAELGVKLFERHTRGVDLTPAGELLLERARVTLSAAEAAAATGSDLEAGLTGALKLGVSIGARWRHTPALLERFNCDRPGVELTVLEGYGGTLWRDLRDGRLDGVLASASLGSPDLRSLQLGAEPWVVLVGRGHRLAGIGPLDAEQLHGARVCVTGHRDGAGYDRAVVQLLGDLGVDVELVPSAPGPALHAAVADGGALALTTAPAAFGPGVMARRLEPSRSLEFLLLWRDETPSPPFGEFIRAATSCVETGAPGPRRKLAAVA
jgi:DNA-binding transcriptional LysR family regulator